MGDVDGWTLVLDDEDARATARLAASLARRYTSCDDPALHADLGLLAHELPPRTKRFLLDFRLREPAGWCVLRGHLVDDERLGPTPAHWRGLPRPGAAFPEEIVLLLYGAILGEPFGWRTQQDGHLVHEVFPIREHELEQLGSGSAIPLTWHSEDAFHEFRGDYLVLGSLRNPDRVATTVGELDASLLSEEDLDVLMQERFVILPDESHLPKNNTADDDDAFRAIESMRAQPAPVAILSGARSAPYLRIDPYFMQVPGGDEAAQRAFDAVVAAIDKRLQDVVLEAGDVIVMDNYRVVHGRRPFHARFDGTDRWLKRVNVTRDLRKSRALRDAPGSRLIG